MKNRRYLMCKLLFISVAGLSILTACKKNDNIVGTNEITTFSGVRMENKIPTSTATADLLRFVVYNDRIYWETGVTINASYFEKIKDVKIGKTHYVNMTDVNAFDKEKKENMSTNISSEPDMYSVKGYNSKYKIMCILENKIYMFECLAGFQVNQGKDLMEKLNLNYSNILSAVCEVNDEEKKVKNLDILKELMETLNEAKCMEIDKEKH